MRKLVILLTAVFVAALLSGTAFAAKERVEITSCVCDEQEDSSFDCTIEFNGASPLGDDDYHAHVTTEQDGVLAADDITPATCKAQTDCQGIAGTDPYTATCTGAPLPDSLCTELLAEGYFFGIVAKVAGDPEEETHGNAVRALKDNFPNCTINEYVPL